MTSGVAAALGGDLDPGLERDASQDHSADRAVARLRPAPRRDPGLVEGFVPVELAERGPRTLRPADGAQLPPPRVVDVGEAWTNRETLFGDI